MAEPRTPLAAVLDNQSYTVRWSVDPPNQLDVLDGHGALAQIVDLHSGEFVSSHGRWRATVGRHLALWRVAVHSVPGGQQVAFGGPTITGFNSYSIELASGAKLRLQRSPLNQAWRVKRHHEVVLEFQEPSRAERPHRRCTIDTKATALSAADLSVLICLSLLLQRTNDIDNVAERSEGAGTFVY